jgi:hypothetical protein
MRPRMAIALLVALASTATALAQPFRTVTSGALLLGEWQDETRGMSLQCLPGKQAILETGITKDAGRTKHLLGAYRAAGQGIWTLSVTDPDHKTQTYTVVFDGAQRLLLQKGNDAPFVFLRSGLRFDQMDRDGDGWISKLEAQGTPLGSRFEEFTSGQEYRVDRRGFEKFLEKYPHLGAKK